MRPAATDLDRAGRALRDLPLDALRPELREAWARGFGAGPLGAWVLDDPRLADRIRTQLCALVRTPLAAPDLGAGDAAAAGWLVAGHGPALAFHVGCAWHRATVLDWITWRALPDRVPDADRGAVVAAIRAVDPETAAAAGLPDDVDEALDRDRLAADGTACIAHWAAGLPREARARIAMLTALPKATGDGPGPGAACLVGPVARAVAAAETAA